MMKMRENRVKRKLERGEVVTMLMGEHNSPEMIDYLGQYGFDSIFIESEHGPVDFAQVGNLSRACDLWGMTSIVRVNSNFPGIIYRTFDLGAQGIMVPHVNTVDDARAVVDASKFGPIGHRGAASGRQSYGVDNYIQAANQETLVTVLIEDIVAIDNLEEIVTVDHIDVFYVAPGDLAQSMGLTGQTSHPDVQAAVDRAINIIVESGKIAGALVNDATLDSYLRKGVKFVGIPWAPWLGSGAASFLKKLS